MGCAGCGYLVGEIWVDVAIIVQVVLLRILRKTTGGQSERDECSISPISSVENLCQAFVKKV